VSDALEEAFYFGSNGAGIYGVLHRPAPDAQPGGPAWVLCQPFGEEAGFAQRTILQWARVLCDQGHWVLRFDYRGCGDSAGSFEDFTVDDYLQDTLDAVAELERQTGMRCGGLCGLRLGATIAALAARKLGRDPLLVLWEPILSGKAYLAELLRGTMASRLVATAKPPAAPSGVITGAAAAGDPFVQGRAITLDARRALEAISLLPEGLPGGSPALVVGISNGLRQAARPELNDLLATAPQRAMLELVETPPLWSGQVSRHYAARNKPAELFERTLSWVRQRSQQIASESPPPVSQDIPRVALRIGLGDPGERPVYFRADGCRIGGILHLPPNYRPGRPAIVIPPHGISRTGFNRLCVKMARALARQGWAVLRFDAHGLGDSEGELAFDTGTELFQAIEKGMHVPDTLAALDFLARELGVESAVIAGVCGGAVTAALTARADERVKAIAPIEMSLLFYAAPGTVDAPPLWVYRRTLLSLKSWRKLFTLGIDFRLQLRRAGKLLALLLHRVQGRTRWFAPTGVRRPKGERALVASLGTRANRELVDSLRACARRIPVLCVFADTDNASYFQQSAPLFLANHVHVETCRVAADRRRSDVSDAQPSAVGSHTGRLHRASGEADGSLLVRVVQGADHNFSTQQQCDELCGILADWLNEQTGNRRTRSDLQ